MNMNQRPRNNYELLGMIKALSGPQYAKIAMPLRREVLLNLLITYINDGNITAEIFRGGYVSLSQDLKKQINAE